MEAARGDWSTTIGVDRNAWKLAAAAVFCCGWGGNQFTPLLVLYERHNGFTDVIVDALLAAYVVGLLPALLTGASLARRYGRKRVMAAALLASALGSGLIAGGVIPTIAAGRVLDGIGVGLAMSIGTTWVVELCIGARLDAATGAHRAALYLTGGLGAGAGLAGVLAQWGPAPEQLPYLVQLAVALVLLALVITRGVNTRPAVRSRAAAAAPDMLEVLTEGKAERGGATRATSGANSRSHPFRNPRFLGLILPTAPWIFATAGVAYAIVPEALGHKVGNLETLYCTVLVVTTLGVGFLLQPLSRRLDHALKPGGGLAGMVLITVGVVAAAVVVARGSAWLAVIPAALLGGGYGLVVVAGLLEGQRISDPEQLPRVTGVYYALAYVGFLSPEVVALVHGVIGTVASLWVIAGLALCCTGVVAVTLARVDMAAERT